MYLIISDLHGNNDAFKAILEKAHHDYDIQGYGILGDMFTLGPSPVEIFEIIMKLENMFFIHGNHEDYLYDEIHRYPDRQIGSFQIGSDLCRRVRSSLKRTFNSLGRSRVDQIKNLTIDEKHLSINKIHHYFCHGREDSNRRGVSSLEAKEYIKDFKKDYFWAGHMHHQFMEDCGNKYFVNPGGSGLPFDGDPAAPYAIIKTDGSVKLERASYSREPLYQKLDETEDEFIPILRGHIKESVLIKVKNI
ncbi:MAG: hypothetical protein COA79_03085 [Planctomycetota bacterium]|nr:MAG: hypothetical protein COA79_03085 [Planctomycetota bacterium]